MKICFGRVGFWFEVTRITSVQRKIGLQSILEKWVIFGHEASTKVISEYHDLGILFYSLKMFGRFDTVASLDTYQITKYQFLLKTHHFLLPDFRRIR